MCKVKVVVFLCHEAAVWSYQAQEYNSDQLSDNYTQNGALCSGLSFI